MLLPILSFGVQTHICNWYHWRQTSVDFEKLVLLEAPDASWLTKSNGLQILKQQRAVKLLPLYCHGTRLAALPPPGARLIPAQQDRVSITKRCSHHLLANLLSFLSFFWLWVFFALLFRSLSGNRLGCLSDFSCFWGSLESLWTSLLELLLLHLIDFVRLCFHFHLSQGIFCLFHYWPIGFFSSMLFSLHVFILFPFFLLCLISSFIPL